MTSCHHLPAIIEQGGLLSYSARKGRGVGEDPDPHYWGAPGKKEALSSYVVCSFMPPWWMCKKRPEELAMVLIDAEAVCCQDGTCFCPTNSARNDYSATEIAQRTGIDAFDECFENPTTYQAGESEIFVATKIALRDFRSIVFCDDDALAYWTEAINETYDEIADPKPQLPPTGIEVHSRGRKGFYFPGNWAPTTRIR